MLHEAERVLCPLFGESQCEGFMNCVPSGPSIDSLSRHAHVHVYIHVCKSKQGKARQSTQGRWLIS